MFGSLWILDVEYMNHVGGGSCPLLGVARRIWMRGRFCLRQVLNTCKGKVPYANLSMNRFHLSTRGRKHNSSDLVGCC